MTLSPRNPSAATAMAAEAESSPSRRSPSRHTKTNRQQQQNGGTSSRTAGCNPTVLKCAFLLQVVAIVVWSGQLQKVSPNNRLSSAAYYLAASGPPPPSGSSSSITINCDPQQQQQQQLLHPADVVLKVHDRAQHSPIIIVDPNSTTTTTTTNKATPTTPPLMLDWKVPETGIPADATCSDLVEHFYRLNDAYRNQPPPSSGTGGTGSGTNDSKVQQQQANLPLVNYAFYSGQGFGRLVDHSSFHCLLALALDRPCVVDLDDRDPYHTWRSFIHTGRYDWEMHLDDENNSFRNPLKDRASDIRRAWDELEDKGQREWKKGEQPELPSSSVSRIDRPADWPENNRDLKPDRFWEYIKPWRADQTENKVLLSPNWGDTWFPHLRFPQRFGSCEMSELRGLIQNAMYAPTPLSLKLHHERAAKVLPDYHPSQKPYGVVHVRTVILKEEGRREARRKNRDTDPEEVNARVMASIEPNMEKCLRFMNATFGDVVKDWWILSDDAATAVSLTKALGGTYNLYHGYSKDDVESENPHSNLPAARGLYGHEAMAHSIHDWVTLHEAKVAVLSRGSYGLTGARGNGKFQRPYPGGACGAAGYEVMHGRDLDKK